MRIFIQSILAMFMEALCFKLFMEAFCSYKSRLHRIKSYRMLVIVLIVMVPVAFLIDIYIVRLVAISSGIFVVAKFFFEDKPSKIMALIWIHLGVVLAVEYICVIVQAKVLAMNIYNEANIETLAVCTSKLGIFFVVLIIRRIARRSEGGDLTETEWTRFLFFPFFSISVFTLIQSNSHLMNVKQNETLLWVVAFGILYMNVVVFYFMRDISRREFQIRENRLSEIKANNQIMLYQSIVDNFNRQNERMHEYKNQIACLKRLSSDRRYVEMERYLEQIGTELSYKTDAVDTHNAVVNVIINSKYHEAVQHGIVMVLKLDDLSELWLSEHDIVVILANLLDNAIEACKKTENRRVIKMKMAIEKKCLVLSAINTYDGNIKSREGILLSTKENSGHEHGIGVKNIVRIVEKYGGSYVIEPQSTEFAFSIMIPKDKKVAI